MTPGPSFPVGASPTSRTYSSVTSNIAGEDYIGLLIGEVTGNWNNTGARTERSVGKIVKEIAVDLPQLKAPVGDEIVVPLIVRGVEDKAIISYEFNLHYDASDIQPLADLSSTLGS